MRQIVLIVTVGGSHQPILTAIRELAPDYVLFFCTGRDEATGQPGSIATIIGRGTPVEVRRGGAIVERLPNIPTLAALPAERFGVAEVPADDLDEAVGIMIRAITDVRRRFPAAELVADYTGGTKTMTAALVMSALESEEVALQLVTGTRADLVKVHDGSQSGLAIGAEGIRIRRAMAPFLAAWGRYAYGEAAEGLAALRLPRDPSLRAELQLAKGLSRAFDAWDRFDHAGALEALEPYRARLGAAAGERAGQIFTALKILTADEDPRQTPARLWDLWLNAQRRAAQCRYDDAVARCYRLLEWTAQWLLGSIGIDTSYLLEWQIPETLLITPNADGKRQAGLRNAWELAAHHLGGAVRQFVEAEQSPMLDQLRKRNESILAHGYRPIGREDWESFSGWIEGALLPLLQACAAQARLKSLPPQLPRQPLWHPDSDA